MRFQLHYSPIRQSAPRRVDRALSISSGAQRARANASTHKYPMIIIRVEIEYLVGAHRAWTKDMKSYGKYACRVYIRIYLFYILKRALFEQDAASGIILLLAFKALYIYIYTQAQSAICFHAFNACV